MERPILNISGRDTDRAKLDTVNSFVEEFQLYANYLEGRARAGEAALADQQIEVENLRDEVISLKKKALDIEMVFKGREELLLSQVSAVSTFRGVTPFDSSAILATTQIKLPPMRRYSGSKPEEFEAFQDAVMKTIFRMSHAYPDENKRMDLVSDHLDAPASGWLTSLRRKKLDSLDLDPTSLESASIYAFDTVKELLSALQTRFEHAFPLEHYYDLFRTLTQGSKSVADYTNKFEELSSRLPNINDSVLKLEYRLKLSPTLRTKMVNFGEASTLKEEQEFAIKAEKLFSEENKLRNVGDNRVRNSNLASVAKTLHTSKKYSSGHKHVQDAKRTELRTAFLALDEAGRKAEIAKRRDEGRCTYDGLSDHTRENCPYLGNSKN